jgi:hypothetical protein
VTTLARLLRLDDGEFPELRAAIEAKPLPKPPAPKPLGWGRDMIAFLRAEDAPPSPAEQIRHAIRMAVAPLPTLLDQPAPVTDWAARLAHAWSQVAPRTANVAEALVREGNRNAAADEYEVQAATAPLLAGFIDLTVVQLPGWRKALAETAEAELALYDAESGAGR